MLTKGRDAGSQWMQTVLDGEDTLTRAAAMLGDFIAQRGPADYVELLVHVAPQSLGMRLPSKAQAGVPTLGLVGKMEDLDAAWSELQSKMGVSSPTAIVSHVNPQEGRRGESEEDIRDEIARGFDRMRSERAEMLSRSKAAAPLIERLDTLSAAHNSSMFRADGEREASLPELASLASRQQRGRGASLLDLAKEVDSPLHAALCGVLALEYACLDMYEMPDGCATLR